MPNLYIIAGCNGAGKTTASFTVLPDILHVKQFVNADEIARGISRSGPDSGGSRSSLTLIIYTQQQSFPVMESNCIYLFGA